MSSTCNSHSETTSPSQQPSIPTNYWVEPRTLILKREEKTSFEPSLERETSFESENSTPPTSLTHFIPETDQNDEDQTSFNDSNRSNTPEDLSFPSSFISPLKRGKKVISLDKDVLRAHFIYPQPEAAKKLGVSLSTLKRRFYECYGGLKRWPYGEWKKVLKKRRLSYILNEKEKPTKYLDPPTIFMLNKMFHAQSNSSGSSSSILSHTHTSSFTHNHKNGQAINL